MSHTTVSLNFVWLKTCECQTACQLSPWTTRECINLLRFNCYCLLHCGLLLNEDESTVFCEYTRWSMIFIVNKFLGSSPTNALRGYYLFDTMADYTCTFIIMFSRNWPTHPSKYTYSVIIIINGMYSYFDNFCCYSTFKPKDHHARWTLINNAVAHALSFVTSASQLFLLHSRVAFVKQNLHFLTFVFRTMQQLP